MFINDIYVAQPLRYSDRIDNTKNTNWTEINNLLLHNMCAYL